MRNFEADNHFYNVFFFILIDAMISDSDGNDVSINSKVVTLFNPIPFGEKNSEKIESNWILCLISGFFPLSICCISRSEAVLLHPVKNRVK